MKATIKEKGDMKGLKIYSTAFVAIPGMLIATLCVVGNGGEKAVVKEYVAPQYDAGIEEEYNALPEVRESVVVLPVDENVDEAAAVDDGFGQVEETEFFFFDDDVE